VQHLPALPRRPALRKSWKPDAFLQGLTKSKSSAKSLKTLLYFAGPGGFAGLYGSPLDFTRKIG